MTNTAYFDCPAGASGDMILSAFLDAGLPLEHLETHLAGLGLSGYELKVGRAIRQGLSGCSFEVMIEHQHHHRHWTDIREMIEKAKLADRVKTMALAAFEKLARIEARMHGAEIDHVHFHEVGAVDSIVDIVGAAIGWDFFDLDEAWASPLPLGSGFIHAAHGRLPLPAPATLALLDGVPTYGTGLEAELVTPTGATLLTTMVSRFGPRPAMTIKTTGHGAGGRDLPDRPNLLRLTLGKSEFQPGKEVLMMAETNIDDMNPEIFPFVLEKLFSAGALDAWLTPIQMKKGRPATQLAFLARSGDLTPLMDLVMTETTTLGLRTYPVDRFCLPRESVDVDTPWGVMKAKKNRSSGPGAGAARI